MTAEQRIADLEKMCLERRTRHDEWWRARHAQDIEDRARNKAMDDCLRDMKVQLRLLQQKVAWLAAIGGVVASCAFHVIQWFVGGNP